MLRLVVRALFCLTVCAPALIACTVVVDRQSDDDDDDEGDRPGDGERTRDSAAPANEDECQVAEDCENIACVCTTSIVNNRSCQNGECEGSAGCADACAAFGEGWTGDTL